MKNFSEKERAGFRICSKCYEELNWQEKEYCPNCGHNKFLPYRDIRGIELKGKK